MKKRKKRKETLETLESVIENLADECKVNGEVNLAIVLYSFLGSRKAALDHLFAEHCQDFARSGLKMIKDTKSRKNN